jgi:hypothetical protein
MGATRSNVVRRQGSASAWSGVTHHGLAPGSAASAMLFSIAVEAYRRLCASPRVASTRSLGPPRASTLAESSILGSADGAHSWGYVAAVS